MRHRAGIGLFVALAVTVTPANAQDDDLSRVRDEYLRPTVSQLESIIADAEAKGVPRSLLVEKAVEGVAKGMPGEVVVQAVALWSDELHEAVLLLGRGTDPAGLAKAAESMRFGVDPEVVRALAGDHPTDYPIMLQTIEDLVHAGVGLDDAQTMVSDASKRGMRGHDVLTMSATLRRLVRDGSSPIDAAATIRLNMRRGGRIPPPPPFPFFQE